MTELTGDDLLRYRIAGEMESIDALGALDLTAFPADGADKIRAALAKLQENKTRNEQALGSSK